MIQEQRSGSLEPVLRKGLTSKVPVVSNCSVLSGALDPNLSDGERAAALAAGAARREEGGADQVDREDTLQCGAVDVEEPCERGDARVVHQDERWPE